MKCSLCYSHITEKPIVGPSDVGGFCPGSTYFYPGGLGGKNNCCCHDLGGTVLVGCCWDNCRLTRNSYMPPQQCLSGVPGAKWKYNGKLGYYQAVISNGMFDI